MGIQRPVIPETVTVHLGTPQSNAQNVTVSFSDYIKNVASSEIYPTWPESSIRANVYAQISFALNKIFTEYYRSRGYDFDITNSTAYDQKFIYGRNIFENVSEIVDDIFTTYIRRINALEPLAARFCNGTTVTCDGLSQWGTVDLANEGYIPYDILRYYYGDNIELVFNTPVADVPDSYPGTPLRLGSEGSNVILMQAALNRISQDYPAIPKIYPVDGIFGPETESAVRRFQEIFSLTPDGVIGVGTWYKVISIYTGVKRLNELESTGQSIYGVSLEFGNVLREGSRGNAVSNLQFFLNLISEFNPQIPSVTRDGYYGSETRNAVTAFQERYSLPVTGAVDESTWNLLYQVALGIEDAVATRAPSASYITTEPYPGVDLSVGSSGASVQTLQRYLDAIADVSENIPPVTIDGYYGQSTADAVTAFQGVSNLPRTGVTDRATWDAIADAYFDIFSAISSNPTQFPGFNLEPGASDSDIDRRQP